MAAKEAEKAAEDAIAAGAVMSTFEGIAGNSKGEKEVLAAEEAAAAAAAEAAAADAELAELEAEEKEAAASAEWAAEIAAMNAAPPAPAPPPAPPAPAEAPAAAAAAAAAEAGAPAPEEPVETDEERSVREYKEFEEQQAKARIANAAEQRRLRKEAIQRRAALQKEKAAAAAKAAEAAQEKAALATIERAVKRRNQANARKAAEAEAEKARIAAAEKAAAAAAVAEEASENAQDAEAREDAVKRARMSDILPPTFFHLDKPVRDLAEALFLETHCRQSALVTETELHIAALHVEAPTQLADIRANRESTSAAQAAAIEIAYSKLPQSAKANADALVKHVERESLAIMTIT